MKIRPTAIADVMSVDTFPRQDHRGTFARFYCDLELSPIIGNRRIVQINHSRTTTVGAIRGMHFQYPPNAEMKLVRCLNGRIWDVAVDLRLDSPTFLKWHAEELSPQSARMMVVPEGCAHGFQVLDAESELLYLHTAFYTPETEGGVRHDDPCLAIAWPLPVADISERDAGYPLIGDVFRGIPV